MRPRMFLLTACLMLQALACSMLEALPNVKPDAESLGTAVSATLTAVAGAPGPAAPVAPAVLRIVYPDNVGGFRGSDLWIIEGSAAPRQLTSSGQDGSPLLSNDGRLVAFRRIIDPGLLVEELWVVSPDGSNQRTLVSQAWLSGVKAGDTATLHRVRWVPGTHTLAFNTRLASEFPGLTTHDNLYLVDADTGNSTTVLPTGTGASDFFYSPDGARLALSSSTAIDIMNSDGTGRANLAQYKGVGMGEAPYIVSPVWSPDGSYLRAVIPSGGLPGPITGSLWHLPGDGSPAYSLASLPGNLSLFSQDLPLYAPDLQHVAYVIRAGEAAGSVRELHIAAGDGSEDAVYASGGIGWWGWAPDGRRFIYQVGDAAYLGEIGAGPRPLFTDVAAVFWPRWVDQDRIIFFAGQRDAWQLRLGAPGGASTLLASPAGDMAEFDFSR